ncbi:hypothetical protein F5X97DRAFT_301271 [Nemania serpens]|nr:hypothetical protein F5X97DRAFT_301271 [Nemania serpens]
MAQVVCYDLSDCYVRFQIPRTNSAADAQAARITKLVHNDTDLGVRGTISDFFNSNQGNLQLFLVGDRYAFEYAGIFPTGDDRMPQEGLSADNVVLSILLPSGVEQVEQVTAEDPATLTESQRQIAKQAFGLRTPGQPLAQNDYFYTTVGAIKQHLARNPGPNGRDFTSIVNGITLVFKLPQPWRR